MTPGGGTRPPFAWRPHLGAWPEAGGVSFRVWAPERRHVELLLNPGLPSPRRRSLTPVGDGTFAAISADAAAGDLWVANY